jgi:predicted phosphodiesterase
MADRALPALRRFGVLGDIHAEDLRLATAMDHLAREGVDATLAVGDIVDGPGSAHACCQRLAGAGVYAVRGNHERWFLRGEMRRLPHATRGDELTPEDREFLAALPVTRRFVTELGDLLLCHGLGDNDMATVKPKDDGYGLAVNDALWTLVRTQGLRFVVCGHSHRPMTRTFEGVTVINAGTLSRFDEPGFVLIDIPARLVTFFQILDGGTVVTVDGAAM